MEIKGKLIGGVIGLFLADLLGIPLGALVGFVVGSIAGHFLVDMDRETEADVRYQEHQRRQGAFIYHVFRLCAKIAKVDGPINAKEVGFMENLMRQQFRLSDKGRLQVIKIWRQAKDSTDPFDVYAGAFYRDFGRERHHVVNMLDLMFAAAAADGGLHRREEELLLRAAGIFHIGRMQYDRIKSRYYQAQQASAQQRWTALDPFYAELGAQPGESLDAIRQKYRKLALEWHPDRLAARGASSEAQRHAKEKFQKINEAWERIETSRKRT